VAVQPKDGIISVGPNTYGHPSDQTIVRLINAGANIWRTDLDGNIEIVDNGTTYIVNPQFQNLIYLPLIMNLFPPTSTPIPSSTPVLSTNTPTMVPTPTGSNVVCNTYNSTQICAWVSIANPSKNSTETVYGRLLINNIGQANQTMTTTWHYKSTSSTCSGITDTEGNASCSRSIGGATSGYQVNIDVSIGGYTATTWFIPN
jgi:hypothetical protein